MCRFCFVFQTCNPCHINPVCTPHPPPSGDGLLPPFICPPEKNYETMEDSSVQAKHPGNVYRKIEPNEDYRNSPFPRGREFAQNFYRIIQRWKIFDESAWTLRGSDVITGTRFLVDWTLAAGVFRDVYKVGCDWMVCCERIVFIT